MLAGHGVAQAPSMTVPAAGGAACAHACMQLSDGRTKRMDQLAIGDAVLAADASTGALTFQPVYFFGHRLSGAASRFVSLTTSSGRRLRLTSDHHLPLCTSGACNNWQEFAAAPASAVRTGHSVLLKQGEGQPCRTRALRAESACSASWPSLLWQQLPQPHLHCICRQRHRGCTGDARRAHCRGWPLQPLHHRGLHRC